MSDEDIGNEKPKGFDISKLGEEMSDDERKEVDERLRRQLKKLSYGLDSIGVAQKVALGFNASGALADIARYSEQLRQIAGSADPRILNMALDQASFRVPKSVLDSLNFGGALARFSADIERKFKTFSSLSLGIEKQLNLMPNIMRDFESSYVLGITRALDLNRIGNTFAALDIGKYGRILNNADALRGLSLGEDFGNRFSVVATGLTEQMQALSQIGSITTAAHIGLGLSGSIEQMLARTIAAQEALAEQEQAPADETTRQKLERQLQLLANICTILAFFLMVALEIEDRLSDDKDAAIRANTEPMQQMQVSIDALTSQLQEVIAAQEAATEQDSVADTAIIELLKEIADTLADQAEMGEQDTAAAPPQEN